MAVIVLGSCSDSEPKTPSETVERYFSCIWNGDYAKAFSLSQFSEESDSASLIERYDDYKKSNKIQDKEIKKKFKSVKCTVTSVSENNDEATVVVRV